MYNAPNMDDVDRGTAILRIIRPKEEHVYNAGDSIPRIKRPEATQPQSVNTELEPVDSYTEFCKDNSYLNLDSTLTPQLDTVELQTPGTSQMYALETRTFSEMSLALITAIDKNEDAVGTRIAQDGRLIVAIADGVSTGLFPKAVARTAIASALEYAMTHAVDASVFDYAHQAIQRLGLEGFTPALLARIEKAREGVQESNIQEVMRIRGWKKTVDKLLQVNALGATTLGVVAYDKTTGSVDYTLKSDTSLAVIKADGSHTVIKNGRTTSQIHYVPADTLDRTYHPDQGSEIAGTVRLDTGDIAMLFSDGLETNLDTVLTSIRDARLQGETITLEQLTRHIKDMLKAKGIGDDVSIAIIAH